MMTTNKKMTVILYSFKELKNNKSNDFMAYTYAEDQLREAIMQLFINESCYFSNKEHQVFYYNLNILEENKLQFKEFLNWVLPILTEKNEVLFSKLGTLMQVRGGMYDPKEAEKLPLFDYKEVSELLATYCEDKRNNNKCA